MPISQRLSVFPHFGFYLIWKEHTNWTFLRVMLDIWLFTSQQVTCQNASKSPVLLNAILVLQAAWQVCKTAVIFQEALVRKEVDIEWAANLTQYFI